MRTVKLSYITLFLILVTGNILHRLSNWICYQYNSKVPLFSDGLLLLSLDLSLITQLWKPINYCYHANKKYLVHGKITITPALSNDNIQQKKKKKNLKCVQWVGLLEVETIVGETGVPWAAFYIFGSWKHGIRANNFKPCMCLEIHIS